jgi:2-polyprenyl-3-methyl-5-hydroxy-6-metoxy-1,4-benzoquinol methylase
MQFIPAHHQFDIKDRLLPAEKERRLYEALSGIYPAGAFTAEIADVEVQARHYWFRQRYMPWMMSVLPLTNMRVLEVGAGTGASTVALAERGAIVTSIDLNAAGLKVAELRAELHGFAGRVSTHRLDATEIAERFSGQKFDMVAYFASLEHMAHNERMTTLRAAWSLLDSGSVLCILDSPNRLWYYDNHTSFQNFFHWLPDELAIEYAAKTTRDGFNTDFKEASDGNATKLARWGRGVSYHDIEIALGIDVRILEVHGEWQFRRDKDPAYKEWWLTTDGAKYHQFLRTIAPDLPVPFLDEEIAVLIRKP